VQTAAKVTDVHEGRLRVRCLGARSPGGCGSGCRCALKWFGGGARDTSVELPAGSFSGGVAPGDTVELSIPDGLLLRAAARAYVFPVAGLIAGAAVAPAISLTGDVAAALGAVLGGVAGHLLAKYLNQSVRRSARLRRMEPHPSRDSP